MLDALEDYALYFEAQRRERAAAGKTISQAEVLAELGIQPEALEDFETIYKLASDRIK